MFLSNKGELTGRAEANYDLRLSQRVILQPAAELNFSAGSVPSSWGRVCATNSPESSPPIRAFTGSASWAALRFARAYGEEVGGLNFVAGVRLWF